ncbi:hypothetical protein CLCR_10264 [Cladophialophora carrionii]|uniref:Uncharacterized protein n=1 Tax=Cladophialophora carrionii TaxID=86049 RepID=A0A1C1CVW9_9EURO|nr:hypothetical protein CLCR_10264 [Cladophialophora carrionii]
MSRCPHGRAPGTGLGRNIPGSAPFRPDDLHTVFHSAQQITSLRWENTKAESNFDEMHFPLITIAVLALWTLEVSAAALRDRVRSTPLQDVCNLPEVEPLGANCNESSIDPVARRRRNLPRGVTSITVGTGTTPSGSTTALTLPFSAHLNPSGPLSGSGTLVLFAPISSANLIAGDVSQSSEGAFSEATCDFYTSNSSASDDNGVVACTGDVVGSGSTNSEVGLSAPARCVACSFTTGEEGSFNE